MRVQGGVVCANLPTCQLFDLSAFRLVGKLESWRGAGGAGASAAGGRADTGWRVQGCGLGVYPGVREGNGSGTFSRDTGWCCVLLVVGAGCRVRRGLPGGKASARVMLPCCWCERAGAVYRRSKERKDRVGGAPLVLMRAGAGSEGEPSGGETLETRRRRSPTSRQVGKLASAGW